MMDFIKKHWINTLGISFIFMAVLYFFQMAIDNGWLPPTARATLGIISGISLGFLAYLVYKKEKLFITECLAGLSSAILYATLAYISFSDQIVWSSNALLITISTVAITSCYISTKYRMRYLNLLSLLGGLVVPFVLQAEDHQHLNLFIYYAVLNISALVTYRLTDWKESKLISFVSTLAIYSAYYLIFEPEHWSKPISYIGIFFLIYLADYLYHILSKAKVELRVFDEYFNLINTINFVFWSQFIFRDLNYPFTFPFAIAGLILLSVGSFVYFHRKKSFDMTSISNLIIGLLVLLIAGSNVGTYFSNGLNYAINSFIWMIISFGLFIAGTRTKQFVYNKISYALFSITTIYWYLHAWDVEWINMFGLKFIPFANIGAIVWIILALIGFKMSYFEEDQIGPKSKIISSILGLISHLIIGGLLTVQFQNIWEAYHVTIIDENIVLSIIWFLYAMLIYLIGNRFTNNLYRGLGAGVLLLSSFKVYTVDLSGQDSFKKVIFLLIIGGITLFIGKISQKKKALIELNNTKDE